MAYKLVGVIIVNLEAYQSFEINLQANKVKLNDNPFFATPTKFTFL